MEKMEPEFNWSIKFGQISESSYDMHIPPDITFKILENGVEYEIEAHKMLMGVVSPVLNRMFFVSDTRDMHAKVLLIKGTTRGAFVTMKNAIYGIQSMKDGLKDKSVDEVFAILDLVTRYQIPELVNVVQSHLASFPLTRDTVLEVAAAGLEKTSTFEKEAGDLLLLCTKFLRQELMMLTISEESLHDFLEEHTDNSVVLQALLKGMSPWQSAMLTALNKYKGNSDKPFPIDLQCSFCSIRDDGDKMKLRNPREVLIHVISKKHLRIMKYYELWDYTDNATDERKNQFVVYFLTPLNPNEDVADNLKIIKLRKITR